MTREEFKKKYSTSDKTIQLVFNEIVDGICDDFESRICENCKYSEKINDRHIDCTMDDNYFYFRGHLPKDFGCNKFKRKDSE